VSDDLRDRIAAAVPDTFCVVDGDREWIADDVLAVVLPELYRRDAALDRVEALRPHWATEIRDGHGANRVGLIKASDDLRAALDGPGE